MPSAWPTQAEVLTYLAGANFTVSPALVTAGRIASAVGMIEQATGWIPFLRDSNDTTRPFNPPGFGGKRYATPRGGGRMLRLDKGLVTLTSLSVSGVAQVLGTDFFLKAFRSDGPYELVEFAGPVHGNIQCISIVGKWGFSATIPDLVWEACMLFTGSLVATALRESVIAGGSKFEEGDESVSYDSATLLKLGKGFSESAKELISPFVRVTAGH